MKEKTRQGKCNKKGARVMSNQQKHSWHTSLDTVNPQTPLIALLVTLVLGVAILINARLLCTHNLFVPSFV